MQRLTSLDDLWPALGMVPASLLMLDYDGTLAPFHVRRELALPLAEVPALLGALARVHTTSVAVLSGRPVGELLQFLGELPVRLIGEHGWEERPPGGPVLKRPLPEQARRALREAASLASSMGWAPLLEMKRTSVVLHTRTLPDARAGAVEAACTALWHEFATRSPVRLGPIDRGVELRASGRDKGTAALELMDHALPDAVCVFVGDDATDEDAFAALRGRGLGVRVGPAPGGTLALARLESPQAVVGFLQRWIQVAGAVRVPASQGGAGTAAAPRGTGAEP